MPKKCISSCDLLLKLLLLSAARANVRDTATTRTTMITENSTYSAYFIIATNFELSHKGFIYVRHTKEDTLPNGLVYSFIDFKLICIMHVLYVFLVVVLLQLLY